MPRQVKHILIHGGEFRSDNSIALAVNRLTFDQNQMQ